MTLTVTVLANGTVQVIIQESVGTSVFRDAIYYPNLIAYNAAHAAGLDVATANERVRTYTLNTVGKIVQVRVVRPAPTGVAQPPVGCVTWGGYWDYVVEGDLTVIPDDAVYAASRSSSGVYRVVIAAPASLSFQYHPEGWDQVV